MHVLIVSRQVQSTAEGASARGSKGGLATYCSELAAGLARYGHRATVLLVYQDRDDFMVADDPDGYCCVHCPRPREVGHYKQMSEAMHADYGARCVEFLRENHLLNVDVVQANDWFTASAAQSAAQHARAPLVNHVHLYHLQAISTNGNLDKASLRARQVVQSGDVAGIPFILEEKLLAQSDVCVAASQEMIDVAERYYGVAPPRFVCVPLGLREPVLPADFDPREFRRTILADDERLVLFTGRNAEQKGLRYLIRAARVVLSREPGTKVLMTGRGADREFALDVADLADRFAFAGFVPNQEIHKLLAVADVGVVPSIYEPFGLSCLEMMAMRLPVVASAVGGLRELVVDGHSGYLVAVERSPSGDLSVDTDALADRIVRLLRDGAQRQLLGMNGYARFRGRFNMTQFIERSLRTYEAARRSTW